MTEIRVPTLGESVTEATIGRWFKKDGDTVAVGALLGQINDGAAGAAARPAQTPAKPTAQAAPPPAAAPAAKAPPAAAALAPSVRRISAETGIDASTVPGSGKDGRVTKGDMLAAIEKAASAPTPVNQPAAAVQVRAPSPA